jgi:PAT family beta-lactamase induction signal transducer AmpG
MAKQTSTRFTATQLALLTSLTAIPRTVANSTTGFIITAIGYFDFFLVCTFVALPGMLLLFYVAPWSEPDEVTPKKSVRNMR